VRSKGQVVGSASHWIANTTISFVFPFVVQKFSVATPFLFFACATLVPLIVVSAFYPETKGRTLEDLQRRLVPADSPACVHPTLSAAPVE
jgi:hypothetical protein